MTVATARRQPSQAPDGMAQTDPLDNEAWTARINNDRKRVAAFCSSDLRLMTEAVEHRCRALGAHALVLTGSTARGRRTDVSDLDFHVIGARPEIHDLPDEIDLYDDEPEVFLEKLDRGDDFVHWTVRHGCILFDAGVLREAAWRIAEGDLWPDARRKRSQAARALEFSEKLVRSGDREAALEHVRGSLTLVSRWLLLSRSEFPLARDELAGQLDSIGHRELAEALSETIHARPDVATSLAYLRFARSLTHSS